MTTATEQQMKSAREARAVFSRVLVGIDGSPESRDAARQAAILTEGTLSLLAAYTLPPPAIVAPHADVPAYSDDELREQAASALRNARANIDELRSAAGKIVRGTPWDVLLHEIQLAEKTLVAVGTHGHGRAAGILLGSTATELIHKAPCSVLVARKTAPDFPKRIVVGVDGSPESAAAYAAAQYLSERHGATLWPVTAHGGKGVDRERIDELVGHRREDSPDDPVPALVASAADADVLVVGSRGLHGLKALGSVSERVAHEAGCSVLVVRGA